MNPPILEVSKLSLVSGQRILHKINWKIDAGQNWVILGANGSGKTCLLKTLTGYLSPTEGDLVLLGNRYGENDWRELRKSIGLVSSALSQMIEEPECPLEIIVSGKDASLNFWGRVTKKDRSQAHQILKQIECTHLINRPWIHLSQGERQRVLIGRAMMAKPSLLILDEPCSGLDPVSRQIFLSFLGRITQSKSAPTLIFVTHHVEEIIPAFTHVLLLKKGRVVASGPTSKTLTSSHLSKTFNSSIKLHRKHQQYTLKFGHLSRRSKVA